MKRNPMIDLARITAVAIVIILHAFLYQIRLENGQIQVVAWAAPKWFYPVTWVFNIMPLFFVAGGFANSVSLGRTRADFDFWSYLARRGRRLVSPLTTFVAIGATLASLVAWNGYLEPAIRLSAALDQLLWFLAVYLVIVFFAPLGVWLHNRFGAWALIGLALGALVVDAWSFSVGNYEIRNLNLLLVWPLCHQLGIAYHRGWFQTRASAWLAIGSGVTVILIVIFGFGYPATSVGFADLPIANIQPPTIAMAALGLIQVGALSLFERFGLAARIRPETAQKVLLAQAMLVTAYLWHIPAIFIAGGLLTLVAWLVPLLAPVLLAQGTVAAASLFVVTIIVPVIARLDYLLIPKVTGRHPVSILLAYLSLVAGTIIIWRTGLVVHPEAPWSTLGVGLLAVGTVLMRHDAGTPIRKNPIDAP